MAENKKGFVLYCDLIHTIKKMPDDKAGLLFKHLLSYVNDENPIAEDLLIELTFEPIKQQLKRDLNKWEDEIIKKGNSGALGNLKRWNNDLYDQVINKDLSLHKAIEIAKHRKVSQCDDEGRTASHRVANIAVTDTVTDTVTVKDINIINQYFSDFENGSHIVEMARTQKTSVEILKAYIPQFKLKANSEYVSYGKFVDHFRNTWLLNKDKSAPISAGTFIKLGKRE